VEEELDIAAEQAIISVTPTPANEMLRVQWRTQHASHARMLLYDARGRAVAMLVDRPVDAGVHTISVAVDAIPSGVYRLVLIGEQVRDHRAVVITR
jgi:hypothetical protein